MKPLLALVAAVAISGCKPIWVSNLDEIRQDLARCEKQYAEPCSLISVPNSANLDAIHETIAERGNGCFLSPFAGLAMK